MVSKVEQWVRPEIRALAAYHVPNPGNLIKLDAMENPYRLPDDLVEGWLDALRQVDMNRYPDPGAQVIKERLRCVMGIPEGQGILLGNGSDELIQILAMAVGGEDRVVMAPEPGFVMYRMIATFIGMRYVGVPLRAEDFSLDLDAMLAAIEAHQPALIFLAYPNNPTGNLWSRSDIETIIGAAPGLVVVDEAYAPFAADSFLEDLGRWDNLLVMRTVSKMGLAGLRLGYLCGPEDWLTEFEKIRLPYNINVLTQASAAFALDHHAVFDEQARLIREERAALDGALRVIEGLQVYPSQANFILYRAPAGRAGAIFESLKARGVLIKNLSGQGGVLADCLRVTVGTPEENARFVEALKASL
jgi:histidinol-phosphate aminotransferase